MDIQIKNSIDRIEFIIEDLKLDNVKKLSEELGFKRPERLYKILRGKNAISQKLAEIINRKYPKYTIEWLRGSNSISKESGDLTDENIAIVEDMIINNEEELFRKSSILKRWKELIELKAENKILKEIKEKNI
ncbi:conserved hypothetical protein [Tenacibaculum maritimum]|uniref:hypothetical protein n=1 Tax=Tenacibaculum maritimum TaxID=107401 RepID=UPI0012E4B905|nr:hypothetical protein [Tenacibaculum maritimum]CAA0144304.1 conserved hypothetical protein [Tenacibaculum maritimum]